MPEKTLRERVKRAKAEGTTVLLKDGDLGRSNGQSRHAAKKSRHLALEQDFKDRSVRHKRAPGEGSRDRPVPAPEGGRSMSPMRKALPAEAASRRRKDGTPKRLAQEELEPRNVVRRKRTPDRDLRPWKVLGPRQANKRGNEAFARRFRDAPDPTVDTASKNGGRVSVSDKDVGEDRIMTLGLRAPR